MQLRFKVPLIVVLVVFVTSVLLAFSSYQSSLQLIDAAGKQELKTTAAIRVVLNLRTTCRDVTCNSI